MRYRLGKRESVQAGVVRIIGAEIDSALKELRDCEADRHEAVHQTRKRCKRIRALLRLVRPSLGNTYRVENARFRDLAQALSEARDAAALVESLEKLRDSERRYAGDERFAAALAAFVQRRDAHADVADLEQRIGPAIDTLQSAAAELACWPTVNNRYRSVAAGLRLTYRRGRRAMALAYQHPDQEHFHEWRKQVKYHGYHLRLLQPLWPGPFKALAGELKTLAEYLGDEHDLAVLRQSLADESDLLPPGTRAVIDDAAERRQRQLRALAHGLGKRVFAERPGQLSRRLGRYWEAWRRAG